MVSKNNNKIVWNMLVFCMKIGNPFSNPKNKRWYVPIVKKVPWGKN